MDEYWFGQYININSQDTHGKSILINCVISGNIKCVKHLVNSGANINLQDKKGDSVIMLAVTFNEIECVKCLLQHNANLYLKNLKGNNVIYIVYKLGYKEIIDLLR
jgi:ankyrin repeat protein